MTSAAATSKQATAITAVMREAAPLQAMLWRERVPETRRGWAGRPPNLGNRLALTYRTTCREVHVDSPRCLCDFDNSLGAEPGRTGPISEGSAPARHHCCRPRRVRATREPLRRPRCLSWSPGPVGARERHRTALRSVPTAANFSPSDLEQMSGSGAAALSPLSVARLLSGRDRGFADRASSASAQAGAEQPARSGSCESSRCGGGALLPSRARVRLLRGSSRYPWGVLPTVFGDPRTLRSCSMQRRGRLLRRVRRRPWSASPWVASPRPQRPRLGPQGQLGGAPTSWSWTSAFPLTAST